MSTTASIHSEIDDTPLARFLAGPDGDAALPGCRGTAAGLHPHRAAHPAQERRHHRHRRPPLRSAQPLSPSHLAWRSASPPGISPRSTSSIRTPARCSAGCSRRTRPANASGLRRGVQPVTAEPVAITAAARHGTAPRQNDRPAGRDRTAARLPPQGRRRRRVNKKLLALYGLKWNPFTPNVPTEALARHHTPRIRSAGGSQQLAGDGGFALVTGAPGCGKSAALRILAEHRWRRSAT